MKVTQLLDNLGQSMWLHNIARNLPNTGTFSVIAAYAKLSIDVDAPAAQLREGARTFVKSWHELLGAIASRSAALAKAS